MTTWSLSQLLEGLHDDIQQRLETCRKSFGHPGTKGDASEKVWLELLQNYLPKRYHAGGTFKPRPLIHIYGGLLAFESDWSPPLGKPLMDALNTKDDDDCLDLGCVAAHGYFTLVKEKGRYLINNGGKPATAFLLELISQLQNSATVPMIDIQAYAQWILD